MLPFTIDGRSYAIGRYALELPQIDLAAWLSSHPLYPKVFWKERDSHIARAAVGNLLTFPGIPTFSDPCPFDLRFYGGSRFDDLNSKDETWRSFPCFGFWLPEIEITQDQNQTQALFYSLHEKATPDALGKIDGKIDPRAFLNNPPLEKRQTPNFDSWKQNIEEVLRIISSGQIDKAVLARKTSYQFAHPLSPWPLLAHLCERALRATLFAFQLSPSLCFLGATPEKLFQREGSLLSTEAVASTRRRGQTAEEDLKLEKELLSSDKEQREFQIVKDFLSSALSPLTEEVLWEGPDRILKASHVQHLHNRLSARLKTGISDADLIAALHPTPALGGYPREIALECLSRIEPFDRGWYGAPIGVVSPHQSSLYVAIRSALISQRTLHLFAGTGIVQGSAPHKEWEELEQKIRPFTELLI